MARSFSLRDFVDLVSQFSQDGSATRHFGTLLKNELTSTEKYSSRQTFVFCDEHGLFLVRIEAKPFGQLSGMITELRCSDSKLEFVIYSPHRCRKSVTLDQLKSFVLANPANGDQFIIQRGTLIRKTKNHAPPTKGGNQYAPPTSPTEYNLNHCRPMEH